MPLERCGPALKITFLVCLKNDFNAKLKFTQRIRTL